MTEETKQEEEQKVEDPEMVKCRDLHQSIVTAFEGNAEKISQFYLDCLINLIRAMNNKEDELPHKIATNAVTYCKAFAASYERYLKIPTKKKRYHYMLDLFKGKNREIEGEDNERQENIIQVQEKVPPRILLPGRDF